ncbi:hypothetical protein SUGI_0988340 [Cryptomeria japonica]|nr:hypothetical protein SUGI_0988340 [Cryptomeria japonica]
MPCHATQYTVGDSAGWDASTDFNTWLQGKTFKVGDSLSFQYTSLHSVMEVSKADYTACSSSNAIQSYTGGNTVVSLKTAGTMYFICGTPGHCAGGMKIAVPVTAAASTTPSTTPAANSPPTTTTPSGTTPTTTSSTSDSAPILKNIGLFSGAVLVMAAAFVL